MKVAVIIPFFNDGNFIEECIDSVINQSRPVDEIIIIDDASTARKSIEKLARISENPRIKVITNDKNSGPSFARNKGINFTNSEYILPLDADDWIDPTFVEKAVEIISENPKIGVVYSQVEFFGKVNVKAGTKKFKVDEMLIDNQVVNCGLFRKKTWKSVGGYNNSLIDALEDWDFWLSIIESGLEFYQIQEHLFHYRIKEKSRNFGISEAKDINIRKKIILNHKALYTDNMGILIKFCLENARKSERFLDQTEQIIELNNEVQMSQSRVHESNQELTNLTTQIREKDTRAHESNLETIELNKKIVAISTREHELNLNLSKLTDQLRKADTRVHESNLKISQLHSGLSEANTASQNLNSEIERLTALIHEASARERLFETEINAGKILIQQLDANLVAANLETLNKDKQLQSLHQQAAALEVALRSILDSTSWKLMGPYRGAGRLIKQVFRKVKTSRDEAKAVQTKSVQTIEADALISEDQDSSPVVEQPKYEHPLSFFIDRAVTFNGYLFVRGWAVKAPSISTVSAIIDGRKIAMNYGSNRKDIRQAFPLVPNAENSGVTVLVKLEGIKALEIEFVDAEGTTERKKIKLDTLASPSMLIESGDFIDLDLKSQYELYRTQQSIDQPNGKSPSQEFSYTPLISIIVPVFNVEKKWLDACIESVLAQSYSSWELCLHDDASTSSETIDCLRYWASKDKRVKVQYGKKNQHISGASNDALKIAKGEFIGLMDNDDELHKDALWYVIDALNKDRSIDYIYTDEDKIDENGEFCQPHFKPDWSPELLESMMYIGHFGVIRRSIIDAVGGFRLGVEGSQDFDLTLRISQITQKFTHIPCILYHWRIIPGSVSGGGDAKSYAYSAAVKALTDHVSREPQPAKVSTTEHLGLYRIQRESGNPSVTIIMPFHNKAEMTIECLESIALSSYRNFKILLISNNSNADEFKKVAEFASQHATIDLQKLDIPFNWSAINNWGIGECSSEYVLLLNNDMTVISKDWIESLLDCGIKAGVGAVGAKLLYEDDTVQHAGIIMQLGGIAGHAFKHSDGRSPGYFGYATVVRNCSAVTGACMLVRRSVALEIGGFNEDLGVAYNDVDFCLRLREASYKVLCTPFAKLYHLESKTRPKYLDDMDSKQLTEFEKESAYIRKRHAAYFKDGDPYYNKALTLRIEDYSLRV